MANITSAIFNGANPLITQKSDELRPFVLAASSTSADVELNPDRHYDMSHDGEDTAGAASTVAIYLSTGAVVDGDASEGFDKAKLLSGRSLRIGPGISQLRFKTAAGAATFTVIPSFLYMGQR